MRQVGVGILLLFAFALGAELYPDPGYVSGLPWYKPERVPRGEYPYVTVYRHASDPENRKEAYLPASTLGGTRAVARDLRRAWMRYEERYYWSAMLALDAPVAPARCAALRLSKGFWLPHLKLNPSKPPVVTSVGPSFVGRGLLEKLSAKWRDPLSSKLLRLDRYSYFWAGLPGVDPDDFCDVVDEHQVDYFIPVYFIPAVKACNVEFNICISNPSYPDPDLIYWDGVRKRLRYSFDRAAGKYYQDYKDDVAAALRPRGSLESLSAGEVEVFVPTAWSGPELGMGAIVSPVVQEPGVGAAVAAVRRVVEEIRGARYKDEKLEAAKWAYFAPSLESLATRLGVSLPALPSASSTALSALQGEDYRDSRFRGIWPLEELKRWFPPAPPEVEEALGYASYFQVYSRLDATVLPDPDAFDNAAQRIAAMAMRSLHFWVVPVIVYYSLDGSVSVEVDMPNIHAIPVAPYLLPYAGSRTYWDWVSVPESYPVPRQLGDPVVPGSWLVR